MHLWCRRLHSTRMEMHNEERVQLASPPETHMVRGVRFVRSQAQRRGPKMRFWRNFDLMPWGRAPMCVRVTVPLSGCIILDGAPGSSGGHTSEGGTSSGGAMGGPAPPACPRAPDLGGTPPPMLSADELVRANELCQ